MQRARPLPMLLLLGGVCCAGAASARPAAAAEPNFILLLADDWGWGDSGWNNPAPPRHTPNLDFMASRGVVFSDFHTVSPVCSPSRVGFMTGRDPARFRIHTALNNNWEMNANKDQANYLDPNVTTVTQLLQEAGYMTGHFGKWHLGSGRSANDTAPLPTAYGIGASCTFNSNDACAADGATGNTSVDIIDRGMQFISDAKAAGRPFYVNIWLHVSHARLDPTDAQKDAVHPAVCRAAMLASNQTECAQTVFVAAQQDADAQAARLWALLGQLNLHESTLILFATDNGPEEQRVYSNAQGTAGPFRGRKRSLYEGGTRVPSFAAWGGGTPRPTIPAGAYEHTVVSAADWMPTVLAIAGVALPPGLAAALDGEDMSHVFLKNVTGQRPPDARAKSLFWEWRYGIAGPCDNVSPHLAVRDGVWKYLANADGTRPELYKLDLYNGSASYSPDFHERRNLAEAYPERVADLAAQLKAWHATLPKCTTWASLQSCEGFTSQVFPGAHSPDTLLSGADENPHEDSESDWWFDAAANTHVHW